MNCKDTGLLVQLQDPTPSGDSVTSTNGNKILYFDASGRLTAA